PPALGIDGFRHLNSVSPVPTVAIGGVREEDISPLRAAGAAGICFVSALCAAPDAEATARRFVAQWHGASESFSTESIACCQKAASMRVAVRKMSTSSSKRWADTPPVVSAVMRVVAAWADS